MLDRIQGAQSLVACYARAFCRGWESSNFGKLDAESEASRALDESSEELKSGQEEDTWIQSILELCELGVDAIGTQPPSCEGKL